MTLVLRPSRPAMTEASCDSWAKTPSLAWTCSAVGAGSCTSAWWAASAVVVTIRLG
jgi:hypothetical protein